MHILLKTFPLTIGNLPKSSRPEPDDMILCRSPDIEHARLVQGSYDSSRVDDDYPERELLRYIHAQPSCLMCVYDMPRVSPGGWMVYRLVDPAKNPPGSRAILLPTSDADC